MNNIKTVKNGFIGNKEAMSLIKSGGKYGCIALGILSLYDLCVKAMDKGYAFNINFDPKGKIAVSFTPSSANVE